MHVHRLVVRAAIGDLRAIPVWRNLMQLDLRVGEWKIRVDREHNVESLSIDLIDPPCAGADDLRARLQSGLPSVMSIDVRESECSAIARRVGR
ncbi:hypothetical protein CA601_41730 [Paraburkholderia hospita]|nr:hypothetical protein CA601_41730 [Paraburkholderia hospita]